MNFKYKIKSFILFLFLFNNFFNLINLSCASSVQSEPRELVDIFIKSLSEFIDTHDVAKKRVIEADLSDLLEIKPADLKLFNVVGILTSTGDVEITRDRMSKFFKISYNCFVNYLKSYKVKDPQLVSADSLLQVDVFIFFINNLLLGLSDKDRRNSYSKALHEIKDFFISNKELYELYKSIFISNNDINISELKKIFSAVNKKLTKSDYSYIAKNKCCKKVLFKRLRDAILKFQQFKEAKIREGNDFFDLRSINLNHILLPAFFDDKPVVSGFHLDLLYKRCCDECRCNISTDFKRFTIAYSCINLVTVDVIEKGMKTIDEKTFFPCNWQLDDLFKTIYELYQDIAKNEELSSRLDYPNSQVLYIKYMEQYGFPVSIVIRNDSACPGAPIKKMVTIFPITSVPINVLKIIKYKQQRESAWQIETFGSYPKIYPMRFNYKKIDFESGIFTCKRLPRNYDSLLEKFEDSKFMNLCRVKQFISLGFNGYRGNTFLHLAVLNQNIEVVDYILNSGLYTAYSEDGFGNSNLLINCYNSKSQTPYMLAMEMKDLNQFGNKIAELFEKRISRVESVAEAIAPEIAPTIEQLSKQIDALTQSSSALIEQARLISSELKSYQRASDKLNDEISELRFELDSLGFEDVKEEADKIQERLDKKEAELVEIASNINLKESEQEKITAQVFDKKGLLQNLKNRKSDIKKEEKLAMKILTRNLSREPSSASFGYTGDMSAALA